MATAGATQVDGRARATSHRGRTEAVVSYGAGIVYEAPRDRLERRGRSRAACAARSLTIVRP